MNNKGPTEIRTRMVRFKVSNANRYIIGPKICIYLPPPKYTKRHINYPKQINDPDKSNCA